jgi:hypothetical protein
MSVDFPKLHQIPIQKSRHFIFSQLWRFIIFAKHNYFEHVHALSYIPWGMGFIFIPSSWIGTYLVPQFNIYVIKTYLDNFYQTLLIARKLVLELWYHSIIVHIEIFPMIKIFFDWNILFWPIKFHPKKMKLLTNLNSQSEMSI